MTYEIIQPPFTLKFREMSKKELKEYFSWFHGVLPKRIEMLISVVQQTPGYGSWIADSTPNSLRELGEWFTKQVETRPRTEEEMREVRSQTFIPIEVPEEELTNRTFSLSIDIGMYLSQVLLRNQPSLQWGQQFGNKDDVDYGQPVLVGFGPMTLNPVSLLVTLAYGVISGKRTGNSLLELYDIWSKMVRKS